MLTEISMKEPKKIALFGYGGHAREVAAQIGQPVTFFVDRKYARGKILSIDDFDPSEYAMMICVAEPVDRESIEARLPKETTYFTFVHRTALIMDPDVVSIGPGSFVGAYSIITTNVQIGKHAILNRAVHIGHDTRIGDFFSAMPGAIVSGTCNLGDRVYLGTNSSVREKSKIDSDVTLGMNSCLVEKDYVTPGIYVGVPAKILKLKNDRTA